MSRVDSQHWRQVKEVFEEALERPLAERSKFLDQACMSNRELREEVESLLKSHDKAGSFMETPAVASAAQSFLKEPPKLSAGQMVKHYEIVSLVGEGGMGEVYLAKDTVLGRRVALKLLPDYVSRNPERLGRFKQEARTASTLSHPNVCVIHEIGETVSGRPFIAMEYIEGMTLRERMNNRRVKLGDALDIAIQLADALTAAHAAGIIHRDIKPENIVIRPDGYLKVLDFGLAKLTERRQHSIETDSSTLLVQSMPGAVMGTAAYMSPEQARGVNVDVRTDIWSLGVVLYEMLCGHPPFVGATPTDVVIAIVEREPLPISQQVPEIPSELERIIRKALRKNPDERYQIVKELAIDLRSLRRDLELDSQLDRSITPNVAVAGDTARSQTKAATGKDRLVNTDQLEASRVTYLDGFKGSRKWVARLGLASLAALMLAGAAFAIYKLLSKSEPGNPRYERIIVTKLTTNGNALFASISPDGKYVAYVRSAAGQQSLWLRQVDSAGHLEIVPPRDGQYYGLVFSPDGGAIYYGYADTGDNNVEVYRVPVLGSGAATVKVKPLDGPSQLSHDGKRVAFVRHNHLDQVDQIMVANSDGSNQQVVATRKWPERFAWDWSTTPAWTHDDQSLNLPIMSSDPGGFYASIYEVRVSDRAERTIPLAKQRFEHPGQVTLLSDAGGVIISAKAQGASFEQVWHLGRDGMARQITSDLSDYRGATLTADSKSLITIQTQTLSNIWLAPKADTSHATQVTSGVGRYFDLAWAPDGKILYASDASGSADIFEMAANGSNVRQLTSGMKRNYAPAVSPDNRFIVLHSNRSGAFQVWRMDRDGSNPIQLTSRNSESNWPQFTADSKTVIYQHFESGASGVLWKVPVEGGEAALVADGFAIRPVVSPDGKWLGFWHNDGKPNSSWRLGLMSLEDNSKIRFFEVAPTVKVQWDTLLRFSSDGRALTYVDHRGGIDNLWAQSIDGGAAKQITSFTDSRIFSFDWSREGALVLSRGVITSDVVLISDASR